MVNQQGLGVGGQQGALLSDPMNALQSLTRAPNPNIPGQGPPMQSWCHYSPQAGNVLIYY